MAGRTAILSVRVVGDAKSGISALEGTERSAGRLSKVGSAIGTGFKVGVGVVAAGAVALLGRAVTKGFDRLSGIENAQAKMKGLGHDAGAVDTIMGNALASVKGTAFGLDEAATTAAGAVAAGIQPGKELESVLGSVANSAASAGTGMDEMGGIYNKVASLGMAQNDVLRQVAERGIPIYETLATQFGVTESAVQKMAKKGEIDFGAFETAMTAASGTVADELGKTATGSMANFDAALGRLGAGLMAGVFPQLAPLIQSATGVIDRIAEAAGPASEALGGALGGAIANLSGWLDGLKFDSLDGFLASAGPGFAQIGDAVSNAAPGFQSFAAELPAIASSMGDLASGGIEIVGSALGFLADNMDTIVSALPVMVAGFAAWQVASAALANSQMALQAAQVAMAPVFLASNIARFAAVRGEQQLALAKGQSTAATVANTTAERGGMLSRAGSVVGMIAQRTAMIASTVATKAATIAQRALNLAMKMNPVGLIIAAIMLFVGIIIWAWNNVDWFRNGILTAWEWIKTASIATWEWITTAITSAWEWITGIFTTYNPVTILGAIWESVKSAASAAWTWIKTAVGALWTGLVNLFQTFHPVGIIIKHWDTIKAASAAAWQWVKDTVSNLVSGLGTAISNRVTQIVTGMRAAWENAKSAAGNAFSTLVSTVTGHIGNLLSTVTSLPGKILSALGNLGSLLVNAGKSLIDGFTQGIKNAFSAAKNAVSNGIKQVRDFFPFSPAKEGPLSGRGYTSHSGKAMITDFAKAMTSQARLVRSAAGDVATAAVVSPQPISVPRVNLPVTPAAGRARDSRAPVNIEVNFNNVVTDRLGVAREIKKVLADYDRLVVNR